MFWIVAIALVAADQLTKFWVRSSISLGETFPVVGNLLEFTYVQNTGAAFSILQEKKTLLIIFTIVLMLGLVAYYAFNRNKILKTEVLGLSLIIGGGIGNLICRIYWGFVTDFIDIHFIPVFNLADIGITVGCVLLFISVIILEPRKEKQNLQKVSEPESEDGQSI